MPQPVPSSPPPPGAPNRRIHYLGLAALVVLVTIGLIVAL